jgi:hypothetical protein
MAQDLGLSFRLSADASGMTSGIARAEKSLQRVGGQARVTSRDFKEAARVTEAVRTPAEKYAQTVSRLDGLLQKGLVTQDVYGRAVAKADAELGDAEGTLDSYGAAANRVESIVNRVSAAIQGVGDASGAIADSADKFVDLGSKIFKVSAVYATFRALTTKREGQGSIVTLALGFTKTIGVIKAAQFALNAFGVEAEGASKVAVAAAVGATALKAAAMAGWDAAGIKKYAAGIDEAYKLSGLATKGMTMLGISAASQAKVFAGLGTAAEGSLGLITSATTLSVLSLANYAATAYMVAKVMFAAKASIEATATSVRALSLEAAMAGKTFNDLQIEKALNAGAASVSAWRLEPLTDPTSTSLARRWRSRRRQRLDTTPCGATSARRLAPR